MANTHSLTFISVTANHYGSTSRTIVADDRIKVGFKILIACYDFISCECLYRCIGGEGGIEEQINPHQWGSRVHQYSGCSHIFNASSQDDALGFTGCKSLVHYVGCKELTLPEGQRVGIEDTLIDLTG